MLVSVHFIFISPVVDTGVVVVMTVVIVVPADVNLVVVLSMTVVPAVVVVTVVNSSTKQANILMPSIVNTSDPSWPESGTIFTIMAGILSANTALMLPAFSLLKTY